MGNSESGAVLPGVVPEEVKCEHYKILLVGPANVGKSCIMSRYVNMKFSDLYEPDLTANVGASAWSARFRLPRFSRA
jgi:GTPase SAR1 family protein